MIASSSVLFRNSVFFFGNEKFIFPLPSWFRNSVFFGGGVKRNSFSALLFRNSGKSFCFKLYRYFVIQVYCITNRNPGALKTYLLIHITQSEL